MKLPAQPGSLHSSPFHLLLTHLNHLWTCIVGGPRGEMWHEPLTSFWPSLRDSGGWAPDSPTAGLQQAVPHLQGRHAKVCNADVVLLIQKQVLGLQVSVAETDSWGSGLCPPLRGLDPIYCLSEGTLLATLIMDNFKHTQK